MNIPAAILLLLPAALSKIYVPEPPPPKLRFPPVATLGDKEIIQQKETESFMKSAAKGTAELQKRMEGDRILMKNKEWVEEKSPSHFHQSLMTSNRKMVETAMYSIAIQATGSDTAEKLMGGQTSGEDSGMDAVKMLEFTSIQTTSFGVKYCPPIPVCPTGDKFRTYDGRCNNLVKPLAGKAGTPLIRFLPPAYQDPMGRDAPRTKGVNGKPLPCAREVSTVMNGAISKPDSDHTMMVMQMGQFVDHDLDISPTAKLEFSGRGIECCSRTHPECFPICIPTTDPFFGEHGRTCMNLVRAQSAPTIDCTMGPRQQINAITHFWDGSNVYGSSDEEILALRDTWGGRMKIQGTNLLPPRGHDEECRSPGKCFLAGDTRANEQPNLALTHTLWMREHNRIASHYFSMGYNHLEAFEMARRLVIAQMQHIGYNEFLPIVLGESYMTERNMHPAPAGEYFHGYSSAIDPTIRNSFSTAAYRFGHSLLDDNIQLNWIHTSPLQFSSFTFNMFHLHIGVWRALLASGLMKQPAQSVDMCFTKEITNKLFEDKPGSGFDLLSLNIQRGRDHGLPSYTSYRNKVCSDGVTINDFDDMTWLTPAQKNSLKSIYDSVHDVDLFVGSLLEPAVGGGLLGQTFQCIVGDQFFRLKYADRFYYENPASKQPFPFTIAQLDEIRKVTLARIFCDNGDNISCVPKNVFKTYTDSSHPNYPVNCNEIPKMDLALFT